MSKDSARVQAAMRDAREYMNQHGLSTWRLVSEHNLASLGRTGYNPETDEGIIALSREYMEQNTDEENRETYVHETAHGMIYERWAEERNASADPEEWERPEIGHGPIWQEQMEMLGYPDAPATQMVPVPGFEDEVSDPFFREIGLLVASLYNKTTNPGDEETDPEDY